MKDSHSRNRKIAATVAGMIRCRQSLNSPRNSVRNARITVMFSVG